MKKWEYKLLRSPCDDPAFAAGFNALGENGWELVGAVMMRTNFDASFISLFTFKREIPEPPASDKTYFEPFSINF